MPLQEQVIEVSTCHFQIEHYDQGTTAVYLLCFSAAGSCFFHSVQNDNRHYP